MGAKVKNPSMGWTKVLSFEEVTVEHCAYLQGTDSRPREQTLQSPQGKDLSEQEHPGAEGGREGGRREKGIKTREVVGVRLW